MVLKGKKSSTPLPITNSDVGGELTKTVDINNGVGVSKVLLDLGVLPVGTGAFTLDKLSPFGFIKKLVVTTQDNEQLANFSREELVLFSFLIGKANPFYSLLVYHGGVWQKYSSVSSGDEIHAVLELPIRIGKAKNVSKLNFVMTLNNVIGSGGAGSGWSGVGTFATTSTSITGNVSFTPVYDDSTIETWYHRKYTQPSIGTDLTGFQGITQGDKVRYALFTIPTFWDANDGVTDADDLISEIQFQSDNNTIPIDLNQFALNYDITDWVDADPDFLLADGSTKAWNYKMLTLPDTVMGVQANFNVKNLATKDVDMSHIVIVPDPHQQAQSKALSPAVFKFFTK